MKAVCHFLPICGEILRRNGLYRPGPAIGSLLSFSEFCCPLLTLHPDSMETKSLVLVSLQSPPLYPWKHRMRGNSVIFANPKSGTCGEMDTREPCDPCCSDIMDMDVWNPSELGGPCWLMSCLYGDTNSMVGALHINRDASDTPATSWLPLSGDLSSLSITSTKEQT